jgi:adenylate cyclase
MLTKEDIERNRKIVRLFGHTYLWAVDFCLQEKVYSRDTLEELLSAAGLHRSWHDLEQQGIPVDEYFGDWYQLVKIKGNGHYGIKFHKGEYL